MASPLPTALELTHMSGSDDEAKSISDHERHLRVRCTYQGREESNTAWIGFTRTSRAAQTALAVVGWRYPGATVGTEDHGTPHRRLAGGGLAAFISCPTARC